MKVAVVPGLYFKSYSRYTEARIPFETLALCGALESVDTVACRIVDFNLKGEDVTVGEGRAVFPGLPLDQDFYRNAAEILADQAAPVCVFNISIHTNGNFFHSIKIAQALRESGSTALIVFCGLGPSSRHTDVLEAYPHIDAVVRGEPEATAIELASVLTALPGPEPDGTAWREQALAALEDIQGLTYRRADSIEVNSDRPLIQNLDELPMPASQYYAGVIRRAAEQTQDLKYLSVEEHIHLEAGRGCPFSCTFCSNTYLWRRRYRLKTPARIVEEMRQYHQDYGARKFLLHQQLFTVNKAKTRAFCETLIASGLQVEWSCFTRSDCVDPELLTLMKKSGCNTVLFGVESGSQRIQDVVRKKTQVDHVSEQISLVIEHGIKPQLSYIIGFPEETREDLQATIDMYFQYKFADDVESQIGLLVPAGGTEVLSANIDDLDFDGVQTTTWYTRFFEENSYDEMASLPLVFPHNHYVKTKDLPRDLLLFVKSFDMAASYLNKSCKYAVLRGLLQMPFGAYKDYLDWRAHTQPSERKAAHWDGKITWRTDVSSIVAEFAQFLAERIAPKDTDPEVLRDLLQFELHCSMLNLRLRERSWDELCAAAPPVADDNFVADPSEPLRFETTHTLADITAFLESGFAPSTQPRPVGSHTNTLTAAGNTSLSLVEEVPGRFRESTFPVFRQIEF